MVHNGIEYSDMQLIAETYDLMRGPLGMEPSAVADTFREWNGTELESYLVEITAEVLSHTDAHTGRPFVDVVRDAAEQKGTGRWTVQTALDLGVPVTGIAEATMARAVSGDTERRAAVREALEVAEDPPGADLAVEDLRAALYAAKVVSYAQGLDMVREASTENDWDVDPADLARIWRDGCIIRARLLGDITAAVEEHPDAPSLLATPAFAAAVADRLPALRRVVTAAVASGVPAPVFSSVLAYVDALRAERLPAALVQGLRDYFGAHTYERVDREGTFHTLWSQDGSEVEA